MAELPQALWVQHPEKMKRELPTLRAPCTELDKVAVMLRVTQKCDSGLTRPMGPVEMLIPRVIQWEL